ncbi:MAG: sigma-54-dependent Fis family transcriptional regulator [Bacteroidetes bacterium]|nr:MAG: sigma-54-dependent Fis family transcriptional regulator [Bacteroidota bacterium]
MNIQDIKNRFAIIGNSPLIERAIDIAMQVAPTDLSVLITGESGTGKEVFPKIIHQMSARKHGPYIAVNCGAIPEGTIDSELFGHEKGSFTGAHEARKGYFEVADGGTIFMDEVAEMPLATQARLLRVLETGEFIKVGSSKSQKTNVRVVAATNVNLQEAIARGKFREDVYYRLNTVPVIVPSLRDRKDDIPLLFRKFAADFASKYRMPSVKLNQEAEKLLTDYYWQGNVRQLKNITEQISIIEKTRDIHADTLQKYLPENSASKLPMLFKGENSGELSERDLLYKVLFDMRKDVGDLKRIVFGILQGTGDGRREMREYPPPEFHEKERAEDEKSGREGVTPPLVLRPSSPLSSEHIQAHEEVQEPLSIEDKEIEMIKNALQKYKGRRNRAAKELGISERTLYRKITRYGLEE